MFFFIFLFCCCCATGIMQCSRREFSIGFLFIYIFFVFKGSCCSDFKSSRQSGLIYERANKLCANSQELYLESFTLKARGEDCVLCCCAVRDVSNVLDNCHCLAERKNGERLISFNFVLLLFGKHEIYIVLPQFILK